MEKQWRVTLIYNIEEETYLVAINDNESDNKFFSDWDSKKNHRYYDVIADRSSENEQLIKSIKDQFEHIISLKREGRITTVELKAKAWKIKA